MLIHPEFDPIALKVGPLAVRWYGLMYLVGFMAFLILGRQRARQQVLNGWIPRDVDDLLFYGVLGVVIGGRLGQVLFYEPGYYFSHPADIIAVWKGGMSFHGGFLGVLVAMAWFGRKAGRGFWQVTDFIAPAGAAGADGRAHRQLHQW
jgi:phosphatidylglycerol:prolipoprotein diacylglycerol transferase